MTPSGHFENIFQGPADLPMHWWDFQILRPPSSCLQSHWNHTNITLMDNLQMTLFPASWGARQCSHPRQSSVNVRGVQGDPRTLKTTRGW